MMTFFSFKEMLTWEEKGTMTLTSVPTVLNWHLQNMEVQLETHLGTITSIKTIFSARPTEISMGATIHFLVRRAPYLNQEVAGQRGAILPLTPLFILEMNFHRV
jgi:hypothetical protein